MNKITTHFTLFATVLAVGTLCIPGSYAEAATMSQVKSALKNRTGAATAEITTSAAPAAGQFVPTASTAPSNPKPSLPRICTFLKSMSLASVDAGTKGDVTKLQSYLIARNFLTGTSATGYYGERTKEAVGRLQLKFGIVSSASDPGYGRFGPRTRAAIAARCGGVTAPTPPSQPTGVGVCGVHVADSAPLYQLLNGATQQHFYTTSEQEKADFISRLGFHDFGVVGLISRTQIEGTVPLQRFKKSGSEDRIYTTHPDTAQLSAQGFSFERNEGYAYPNTAEGTFGLTEYHLATGGDHSYFAPGFDWLLTGWGYVNDGVEGYVCPAGPYIYDDVVLAYSGVTLEIRGSGFGENPQSTDHYISFKNGSNVVTVASNSSSVVSWYDNLIKLRTPAGLTSSYRVSVTAGATGASNEVPTRVYAYSSYPSYSTDNPNGRLPLDIALDGAGTVWNISEFTRGIESLTSSLANRFYKDVQPGNPIFWIGASSGGTGATTISEFGEDVDVAKNGDVWYTQGSDAYEQKGGTRLVQLTPTTGKQRCYNMPQDGTGLVGVLIDDATGTVWAAASSPDPAKGNFLTSFKPGTFSDAQASCTYDYIAAYPANWCAEGETDGCFTKYPMPAIPPVPYGQSNVGPAHLAKGRDGAVWFTGFWGNVVGFVDPSTKIVTTLPLPKAPVHAPVRQYDFGSSPWQIAADSRGDIWLNEYAYASLIHIDPAARYTRNCTVLDASGNNPCMSRYALIYDPRSKSTMENDLIHSIAADAEDNIWFTTQTYPADQGEGYVGMLSAAGDFTTFPSLRTLGITGGAAGIALDPTTKDIWFSEFWMGRIGHLKYIP